MSFANIPSSKLLLTYQYLARSCTNQILISIDNQFDTMIYVHK